MTDVTSPPLPVAPKPFDEERPWIGSPDADFVPTPHPEAEQIAKNIAFNARRDSQVRSVAPRDVTSQFTDLGDEDTIFRCDGGVLVKVKTWHDEEASGIGNEVFRVSGAIVGPDGKVLTLPTGKKAIHQLGRTATIHSYAEVSIQAQIDALRIDCVLDTLSGQHHHDQRHMIKGIGRGKSPVL